ncbi:MAG: cupin domain-containing protein [Deltaproteobacteria bacterium]|nr:cupin domain-containing protein [Deltaproteobacteria bacterium]
MRDPLERRPETSREQSENCEVTSVQRLPLHRDLRGIVVEILDPGELVRQRNVHLVLTEPGKIRGNHYHATGVEVIALIGPALASIREGGQTKEFRVSPGEVLRFVIPPGIPHAFKNTGQDVAVLVAFNSVPHDPAHPDTIPFVLMEEDDGSVRQGEDSTGGEDAGDQGVIP